MGFRLPPIDEIHTARTQLLAKLANIIHRPVKRSLWSLLWVANIDCLRDIVRDARREPSSIDELEITVDTAEIYKRWTWRFDVVPYSECRSADASAVRTTCLRRDQNRCSITHVDGPSLSNYQAVNAMRIYPPAMAESALTPATSSEKISSFWNVLCLFWGHDKAREWRQCLTPGSDSTSISITDIESPTNVLCVHWVINCLCASGNVALKPLSLSPDKSALEIEFHWLYPMKDTSATMPLDSTAAAAALSPSQLQPGEVRGPSLSTSEPSVQSLVSGTKAILTTEDPEGLPLPAFGLLEMAWYLNQVVALMKGAEAEIDWFTDEGFGAFRNPYDNYDDYDGGEQEAVVDPDDDALYVDIR